jgi:hypothetical protein
MPLVVALPGGCTLPRRQGTTPLAQNGEVGVTSLNLRGSMYYRCIPSATHQIGPNLRFPGSSYTQSQSLIWKSGFTGIEPKP